MTGAFIIIYQFFREYRSSQYDKNHNETDAFKNWNIKRYTMIKKGSVIMAAGIALQALLVILPSIIRFYKTVLK